MTTTIRSNADGSKSYIQVGGTDVVILGTQGIEAGSFKPGAIAANDLADGALVENSVNGIGYGPGAGGTVTQATSKSTAVTLNKPCGYITMNAASLAAGTGVTFQLNNNLIASGDTVLVNTIGSFNYSAVCLGASTEAAWIRVTNLTGSSLSDVFNIAFTVIKGATS